MRNFIKNPATLAGRKKRIASQLKAIIREYSLVSPGKFPFHYPLLSPLFIPLSWKEKGKRNKEKSVKISLNSFLERFPSSKLCSILFHLSKMRDESEEKRKNAVSF